MTLADQRERCLREIAECIANQRRYPEERILAALGEMDWRDELARIEQQIEQSHGVPTDER